MTTFNSTAKLQKLATLVRYFILTMTTEAGSGHLTSALSATDLITCLFFGGIFKFDVNIPMHPNNDRFILSKGHASPLVYALWAAAGKLTKKDILTYRKFGSPLEGHPMPDFQYIDVATGSLGQGLSIGVGMALNAKYLDKLTYKTFVLLGDSEMTEGSQWEAMQLAAHYRLNNLIGIIDVNRLGQRGETMYGWDLEAYQKRISSFGWKTILLNGHSITEIMSSLEDAIHVDDRPVMLIAKTIKGKGISFIENLDGWHGIALKSENLDRALHELGSIDLSAIGEIALPQDIRPKGQFSKEITAQIDYPVDKSVATRKAYGNALVRIYSQYPDIVSLDSEVSNSTYAMEFENVYPERFFEMYIAEQNMVGVGVGLSSRGKIPFVSTFAAFFARAFDQIRMSQYSQSNIKFVGSHAGVSIGEDGPSQMGLEDIAMFRTLVNGVVLYPSDAVSTEKLVEEAAKHSGNVYIRTTRQATPIIYGPNDHFTIGGCKILRMSDKDKVTVVGAGVTLHEALKAFEALKEEKILIRVIDLYSIKPLDENTLRKAAHATRAIITVEDHYAEGGIGETVMSALAADAYPIYSLHVNKKPKSGKPRELLDFEEISWVAIVKKVKSLL